MNKFSRDDKIKYIGSKFAAELAGKTGWVIASVLNDPGKYVVEFDGLKEPDFIMPESSLAPAGEVVKKEEKTNDKFGAIEIRRNRRRSAEDE